MAPVLLGRPDVVHFEWESAAVRFLALFDACDCPVVVSVRGSGVNVHPFTGQEDIAASYPEVFARAAAVHCVSEAITGAAAGFGLDPAKARVIRPAVDTRFFSPRPAAGDGGEDLRIVSVGALTWPKGHGDALEALALLVDRGVPARLEIAGAAPGPESAAVSDRDRLRFLAAELGVEERVTWLGHLPRHEVRDRMRAAAVLLQGSWEEGLPNTVLEAMACGLPVVATDVGGVREAVADGVEGLLCPPRSPRRACRSARRAPRRPRARSPHGGGRARASRVGLRPAGSDSRLEAALRRRAQATGAGSGSVNRRTKPATASWSPAISMSPAARASSSSARRCARASRVAWSVVTTASASSASPRSSSSSPPATRARKRSSPRRMSREAEKSPASSGSNRVLSDSRCASGLMPQSSGALRGPGAPAPERVEDVLELGAPLGQLIHARGGGRRQRAPAQDARGLQLAEALGQHVGAGVGKAGAQIGEALGAEHQLPDDHQGPALADPVQRSGDPTRIAVSSGGSHTAIVPEILYM